MNTIKVYYLDSASSFLKELIGNRLRDYLQGEKVPFLYEKATIGALKRSPRFQYVFKNHLPEDEEFIIVLLALIPHLLPDFFTEIIADFLQEGGELPEFGGIKGNHHRGIIPTGETALFVLSGKDLEKRSRMAQLLSSDSWLIKNNILSLEPVPETEPRCSGRLVLNEEASEYLLTGKISRPKFSLEFGAEFLATEQSWDDLVLNPHTVNQIREIEIWLRHNQTLLNDWGMKNKLKPGYRALFHGPPGTGKTMTAMLIGKYTQREVYRVDLSKIVSKYVGETEKNLSKIFDKGQNKDWILFFDEADAIFGKRTNVKDAHDKYANQEVAYLLQKIEQYTGLVILASNLKSNIDEAFTRRIHTIIYFPKPTPEERVQIWKRTFPAQVKFEPDLDLEEISLNYELTGANIVNVVHKVCLELLSRNTVMLSNELLIENIKKEYLKEGKMI